MRRYCGILPGRYLALLLICLLILPASAAAARVRQLSYAGATTLQRHFMPQAAKLFKNRNGIEFNISGGNSGPGIQALLDGTVDIAGSGRFLTAAEKAAGLVEHLIGWDALYVIAHADNPVETLSRDQLQAIFSGRIQNWQEVGGADLPIMVVTTPPGSGMRSNVSKKVLRGEPFTDREVLSPIVHDADRLVDQFPTAVTILSASMIDQPGVRIVRVDDIMPDKESISSGRYPLIKPLLLVTKASPADEIAEFVALAKSRDGQQIIADKFFPVNATADTPSRVQQKRH